jgi:predicted amidohydrolase
MFTTTNPQDTQKLPRIAAIQMCSSHIVDENLVMTAQLIEEAAANGQAHLNK